MPACDEKDPIPCKTQAELDAEETPREKLDQADARHPAVSWALGIGGFVVLAGMLAKACLVP